VTLGEMVVLLLFAVLFLAAMVLAIVLVFFRPWLTPRRERDQEDLESTAPAPRDSPETASEASGGGGKSRRTGNGAPGGEPCSKAPPQAVRFPISEAEKAHAEAEMAARPDEDWSLCYAIFNGPGQDGSVIPVAEAVAKLHQMQQQVKSKTPGALDAAGNPANESPESKSNAERNKCLEETYEGMSIAEKGERSRQVKAEAEARGVSVYDVVGC
jgi:hypothetical protein